VSEQSACPCEGFDHPKQITNSAGRDVIEYRVGDYLAFRNALLLALPDEKELPNTWLPSAQGDLALQMVEWWAYLADILTFYNERIANESYLRTADLAESVKRLIQVLGYRPRPGIGAQGVLAALLNTQTELTLPAGFQVQSKPGPGKQPQIFETDVETILAAPDVVSVDPPPDASEIIDGKLLVKGSISSVKVGDQLLVMARDWSGEADGYAIGKVTEVQPEKDPRGKSNTRIVMSYSRSVLQDSTPTSYRLLRSTQSAHLWPYESASDAVVFSDSHIELDSLTRQIQAGDPILIDPGKATNVFVTSVVEPLLEFELEPAIEMFTESASSPALSEFETESFETISVGDAELGTVGSIGGFRNISSSPQLVSVSSYKEQIWNANTASPSDPTQPPKTPDTTPAIPILHSSLDFNPDLDFTPSRAQTVIRYAWQDVGELIATPATSFVTTANTLTAVSPAAFTSSASQSVMIEAADGTGASATGSTSGASLQLFNLPSPPLTLSTPLNALFDLLSVSRGATVSNEILGSGDATVAGQEFVLKKSPLTYLLSAAAGSDVNYKSTLQVWVDGLEWKEASSFYEQAADAQVFVTREDEEDKTHVLFGDGINGARLSSGVNNVIASYRYGSGADSPEAGSLTVILKPQPNLKSIRNPVAVGGGADPDPADQIQRYAPRSVLTFGRAVSADDYETIAAQTPGVARARSYWTFDAEQQRALIKVYVGDDNNAKLAAQTALAAAADPNRPVSVATATLIPIKLSLTIKTDPRYIPADVSVAVRAALVDPDTGLFGANVVRIGQFVYHSQICAACLGVPGVLAAHSLIFLVKRASDFAPEPPEFRHDPGEGGFFQLLDQDLNISTEGPENAG
jgi:hypothetical protein